MAGGEERTGRRLPRILTEPMWVLGLVILMDETDKSIVRGLIQPLQDHFHVGDAAIGLLVSLGLLVNGLITVPAGYLADRWNRTRSIGHTVVAWSLVSAMGALSLTFGMLVGFRSMLGFGQAITEPSAASLIGDYYPVEQRGKAFSIQQVMLLAGTGLGVAVGGVLGVLIGWRWSLVVVGLPGLAVAALVYKLREPKRGTADRLALGATEIEHDDTRVNLFADGFWQFLKDMVTGLRADLKTIINIRTMRYALVGVAALLFTVTAIAVWLPQYYVRNMGVPEGTGEVLFGALAIAAGIPGVLIGGRIADKYVNRIKGGRLALPAVFLFVGSAIFTASYLLAPSGQQIGTYPPGGSAAEQAAQHGFAMLHTHPKFDPTIFAIAYGMQLIALFVVTMAIPGLRAGLTDAIPAHLRGAGFGAFNLIAVVFGQAAAPLVVSIISTYFDENLRTAFLVVSPLSFIGAAVLFRARKFLDEDMQKIMMAVLVAMQEERDRVEAEAAAKADDAPDEAPEEPAPEEPAPT